MGVGVGGERFLPRGDSLELATKNDRGGGGGGGGAAPMVQVVVGGSLSSYGFNFQLNPPVGC